MHVVFVKRAKVLRKLAIAGSPTGYVYVLAGINQKGCWRNIGLAVSASKNSSVENTIQTRLYFRNKLPAIGVGVCGANHGINSIGLAHKIYVAILIQFYSINLVVTRCSKIT